MQPVAGEGEKLGGYGLGARIGRAEVLREERAELAEVLPRGFDLALVAAGGGDLVERARNIGSPGSLAARIAARPASSSASASRSRPIRQRTQARFVNELQ